MKLIPKYSYEYNCILNENFSEKDQIQNFASLLSDKERFLYLLTLISKNEKLIEEHAGFPLPKDVTFYIVRAEKFKSFSEPITIEYSLLPEEMLLFLLKEILKSSMNIRFPDEMVRDMFLNSFIDFLAINGDWGDKDLVKFTKNLHTQSERMHPDYRYRDIDFSERTLRDYVEAMYD